MFLAYRRLASLYSATLTDMAKAYGLTQACLSRRLNIYKWDIEKALTTPTKNSSKPITDHKGNWYKSLSEHAEAYGLDRKTITYRLTSGWTLEDALTKPARSKK